ncbi:MAG TPA: methyltransferase domain-containing protein [Gemmatimonadaceae bacterium]
MTHAEPSYIPAAGRHGLLPLYDLLAMLLGAGPARRMLVEHAAPRPGERVLDIGAGTGSLTIALQRRQPAAEVVALDPDPRALAIARRKAERHSLSIRFDRGFADALPYPDASFGRVASSFMFHHLSRPDKERMLREVRRVLRPGGRFHLLDFDGPVTADAGIIAHRIHASQVLRDNGEELVLALLRAAGFPDPLVVWRRASRLAHMVCYEASLPA